MVVDVSEDARQILDALGRRPRVRYRTSPWGDSPHRSWYAGEVRRWRGVLGIVLASVPFGVACSDFSATDGTANGDASAGDGAGDSASGSCDGSDCVVTIADDQPGPFALALDADYVYWTCPSAGTVSRRRKDGSGAVEQVAFGQPSPKAIAVTPTDVYWANAGDAGPYEESIVKQQVSCPANACLTIAVPVLATALRAEGTSVYYSRDVFLGHYDGTTVKELCNTGNLVVSAAVGKGRLFASVPDPGYVASCSKTDPQDQSGILGNQPPSLFALAAADPLTPDSGIEGSDVYVTFDVDNSQNGGISVAHIGQDLEPIATGERNAHAIAVDATYVYWTATGGGTVRRRRRDLQGPPETIASGQESPTDLAIDDTGVYWVTAHSIRMHPK
jgi:hypothetical protein